MMLTEKHRPADWTEIIGQDDAIAKIQRVIRAPTWRSGCLLLTGPTGTGKTSAARLIGAELNPDDPDATITIESRSCTLERVRDIEADMHYFPWHGQFKTYIIDEAHAMSHTAQDYCLGLLERIPPHRVLVATSTETKPFENSALTTRFIPVRLQRIDTESLAALAKSISEQEGLTVPAYARDRIVREAAGSARAVLTELMAA